MHTFSDRLLTVHEAALRLRCSTPTIYRRIAAGELPATRLGNGPAALRISRARARHLARAQPDH